MGNFIISLVVVVSLIIMKAESTITNKKVLAYITNFHLRISNQMLVIINAPYDETRKRSTKWIAFPFIGLAILNYISMMIFGADSIHNPLKNNVIFYCTCVLLLIVIGHLDRKDIIKMGLFIMFAAGLVLYALHANVALFDSYFFMQTLPVHIIWKDILILLTIPFCLGMIALIVLTARLICYILYLIIRLFFRLCLFFSKEKPLRPLILVVDIVTILAIPILVMGKG
ncbi:hypothetical protein [Chryseobacterium sp. c4a]|uniref:hypothetical protein n=1 Tax=Chryseobacterium sp. c4a TaxID=1573582 RepID=UPI00135AF258|nr:hypothetical protein [Chryseobacterium sp. c4a]